MVVDATGQFNVIPLATAKAFIYGLQIVDLTTNTAYIVYPSNQQPYCTVGGLCEIDLGLQNNGTGAGTCYVTITRLDTNEVLLNQQYTLAVGQQQQITGITFTMPNGNVGLKFEIGHL